ncbi:ABC transporter substrate-binding protein [Asticcacaulis sp. 201]|uniref:ABC transporter substrate-binding protein n=1 Tax=Asticcacaulis sp. 201 TaxID=3028787 RepID=UPI0029161560|nr:ABC transporter substrate-binding protein [Asticcacaulis sp. 201]MDV6330804.1 ABC transporter substrate-binding protein [Asticcacaulis sp. 201]
MSPSKLSRRFVLFSLSAGVAATAVACSPKAGKSGGDNKSRTLTATIGYPEPHTLFAPGGGGGGPGFTGSKVLERLGRFNKDRSFSPVLAESWVIAPDKKSVTFTLRRGIKWHDGKDFTADDVAWSAKEYWKPFYPQSILDYLDGVDVAGSHEVTLRFDRPVPEFSLQLLFSNGPNYILPKHLYADKDILLNPVNAAPIGTGPWLFSKWVRGSHAEFTRNPSYWRASKGSIDKLIIRWWREPASRAAALETGELDAGFSNPVPLNDIKRLQANPNLRVQFEDEGLAMSVYFNVKNPVVSDVKVRRALAHAIDKDFIAKTIYYGYAKPAISPILSTNDLYFTDDVPKYAFDPLLAARLLDEAGYPVKPDGKRFAIKLLASGWSEENGKVGAYLKQVFADLKIDVSLRVPDRPNSLKALYTDYDFDVAYSQGGGTSDDLRPELVQLFTTAGIKKGLIFRNASRYSSPQMDALVSRITIEIDPEKRKDLIQQFARLALTDLPMLPVVEWPSHVIFRKTVQLNTTAAYQSTDSWADAEKA